MSFVDFIYGSSNVFVDVFVDEDVVVAVDGVGGDDGGGDGVEIDVVDVCNILLDDCLQKVFSLAKT